MNLNLFIDLERGPRSALVRWLQRRRLIADPLWCAQCNIAMELTERNDDHVDGFLWWVQGCNFWIGAIHVKSETHNGFLLKSNVVLLQNFLYTKRTLHLKAWIEQVIQRANPFSNPNIDQTTTIWQKVYIALCRLASLDGKSIKPTDEREQLERMGSFKDWARKRLTCVPFHCKRMGKVSLKRNNSSSLFLFHWGGK